MQFQKCEHLNYLSAVFMCRLFLILFQFTINLIYSGLKKHLNKRHSETSDKFSKFYQMSIV